MNFASAVLKMWRESEMSFASSGYAIFNIEIHIVCIIILAVLFNRQQGSSDQTESRVIWTRLVFIQIIYCVTGILRVLADVGVLPNSALSQFFFTSLNFLILGCVCWLIYVYIELSLNPHSLDTTSKKIIVALPFMFNIAMVITSPLTGWYIDISDGVMKWGAMSYVMSVINLSYPVAALIHSVIRRRKMSRYERDTIPVVYIYPAIFMLCGPLKALNWKTPFFCYAMIISDIFVYISYADSLVSIDPLTKIPNRNGLIRHITERMNAGNTENLYVFAVDIDDLGSVNSAYGRQEGDHALMVVANALKKFRANEHKCYASRYYSDEFIIAADIESDEELELFTEHIRNYISNAVIANQLPYYLRVSIGHAKYEQYSKTETISGLIEEARRMMNENKEQRKFQNIWQKQKGMPV